jgi:hypothetical protein
MKPVNLNALTAGLIGLLITANASYAFYNPTTGRWLSRDPVEERARIPAAVEAASHLGGQVMNPEEDIDIDEFPVKGVSALPSGMSASYVAMSSNVVALYGFCLNDPSSGIDPLGENPLIQRVITIVLPRIQPVIERGQTFFVYNGQRFAAYWQAVVARGIQAHIIWQGRLPPGFQPEFWIRSINGRADAVNLTTRVVIELKPNNVQAIQRGIQQVEWYRLGLQAEQSGCFQAIVQPYIIQPHP